MFSENLAENQWHEAGQAGFEIATDGPESIRVHLNDMQQAFLNTRHAWGPKQIYGRLYEWLAYETDDTAYDPLRDIMTEHAFHTLPMGSEHEIFGRRPAKRILHSVHSAHLETGAHPKRLRKVLLAVGLIDHSQLELSDERILFSAKEAKYYLDRIEESMSLTKVRTYINATRPVEQVLFKAGILKPWLRGGTEMFKDHAFAKRDLDEFLRALTSNAVPALDSDRALMPVLKAAKIANCTMPEVVQLILDGKLDTVRTDPKLTGFLSVLVDPNEIKPLVRLEDHDGFSLRTVEQKLKTTTRVVRALVDRQYLLSETAINPVNRCPQTIVKKDRLEAFNAQYATARSLGLRFGVGFQSVIKHLSSSGIEPAFPVNEVHTSIYDRKIASERLAEFYEQVP